jgi:bacillithiol system protein YtxJ
MNIVEIVLGSEADWERVYQSYKNGTDVLIFKRSPICTISRGAENNFKNWLKSWEDSAGLIIAYVDVIDKRSVSQKIAVDVGVEHESPQLIWLRQNVSDMWSRSHSNIYPSLKEIETFYRK